LSDLVIFGTGELARLARRYLDADSAFSVVAYSVDDAYRDSSEVFDGLPLLAGEQLREVYPPERASMFVAIGYRRVNRGRAEVYQRFKDEGYELISYVSSRAIVAPDVEIGDNCFVFEGVIVQPFVRIGNDTIIWSGACVAHDTTIGDHCFIAPMASISGNVEIGSYAFIGNNATVRDGVVVAPSTVVGAGALIKADTEEQEIYAPARSEARPAMRASELDRL